MRLLQIFVLGGVVAATLTGPAGAQGSRAVTVTGTFTNAGVQCRALRGDDGVLYTMRRSQAVRQFRDGDRVKVTGTVAEVSICQQGTTIDNPAFEKAE